MEPRCEGFSEGVGETQEPSQFPLSNTETLREGSPDDEKPSRDFVANRERCDGCEGFFKDTEEKLGMTISRAIELWTTEGKPVIHLGPGENCFGLEKLLSHRDINEHHLEVIRRWLKERKSNESL